MLCRMARCLLMSSRRVLRCHARANHTTSSPQHSDFSLTLASEQLTLTVRLAAGRCMRPYRRKNIQKIAPNLSILRHEKLKILTEMSNFDLFIFEMFLYFLKRETPKKCSRKIERTKDATCESISTNFCLNFFQSKFFSVVLVPLEVFVAGAAARFEERVSARY